MMEKYFEGSDGVRDARPEYHYQVGVTPDNTGFILYSLQISANHFSFLLQNGLGIIVLELVHMALMTSHFLLVLRNLIRNGDFFGELVLVPKSLISRH